MVQQPAHEFWKQNQDNRKPAKSRLVQAQVSHELKPEHGPREPTVHLDAG